MCIRDSFQTVHLSVDGSLVQYLRRFLEGDVYKRQDRSFLLHNTTLRVLSIRFCALRHHLDTFNDCAVLINNNLQYTTSLTLVFTGDYINCIAFFNM